MRQDMWRTYVTRSLVTMGCVLSTIACSGGDITSIPSVETPGKFWALRNNVHVITIAKDSSYTIVTSAYSADGTLMTELPKPRFSSSDALSVSVDSNGVLTGHVVSSSTRIIATLTVDGVTRSDTLEVAVTDRAYALKSIELLGLPGDPAIIESDGFAYSYAEITDSSGAPVFGLAVEMRSLDTSIATISYGSVIGHNIGKTKIVVSTNSFGRTLADTVDVWVKYSTARSIYLSQSVLSNTVVIGVGGTVTWTNYSYPAKTADIIFDTPSSHIVDGNIPELLAYASATRAFTAPGVYTYKSPLLGIKGAVIVYAQPQY